MKKLPKDITEKKKYTWTTENKVIYKINQVAKSESFIPLMTN